MAVVTEKGSGLRKYLETSGCIVRRHLSCIPLTLGRVLPHPQPPKPQDWAGRAGGREWDTLCSLGTGNQHKGRTGAPVLQEATAPRL